MTRTRRWATIALAAAGIGGLAACEPAPPPTAFTVVDAGDLGDATPGDGVCEATAGQGDCTLRAAIEEGNAAVGKVEITLAVPPGSAVGFGDDRPSIDGSTTIIGDGTHIHGGFDHVAGDLVLRNVEIVPPPTSSCGSAVTSLGRSVLLDRVRIANTPRTAICAGSLVVRASEIQGNESDPAVVASGLVVVDGSTIGGGGASVRIEGDGPFYVVNSVLPQLEVGEAQGRILFSFVTGAFTDQVEAGASLLACEPGSGVASLGHNLDEGGSCGADATGDQAPAQLPIDLLDPTRGIPVTVMPAIGAPSVDAIPAGTPLLCDGSVTVDQRGEPRDPATPCDIGPAETQVGITIGDEEVHDIAWDTNVHVNVHGTVAATFPGDGGAAPSVGRWAADGTVTLSNDPDTWANDIDDDGTVVGYKSVGGVPRPWVWPAAGTPQVVDGLPGASQGEVLLANDGIIVGSSLVDGTRQLWWQGPGGTVQPVVDGDGWTEVLSLSDGHLLGSRAHPGRWWSSATVWHLADGTVTELPIDDLGVDPSTTSTAMARSVDGDVYGVVDGGAVVWRTDGSVAHLSRAFGGRTIAFVEGRPVILSGLGCWNCTVLLVGAGSATDARTITNGVEALDIADDGSIVGVRNGQLVRTKLSITG